jgi:cysteine synthase
MWWPWSRPTRRFCPAASPGPHKIQGIGAGFVPGVLNTEVYDEIATVSNDEALGHGPSCRPP